MTRLIEKETRGVPLSCRGPHRSFVYRRDRRLRRAGGFAGNEKRVNGCESDSEEM